MPLIQVSARIVFKEPIKDLDLDWLSDIRSQIKGTYPGFEIPRRREAAPGETAAVIKSDRINSATFTTAEGGVSLRLQDNLVVIDWGKTHKDARYPRFPYLLRELLSFAGLVEKESGCSLNGRSVNMLYANLIETTEVSEATLKRYIRREMIPSAVEGTVSLFELLLNWKTPEDIDRRLEFKQCDFQVMDEPPRSGTGFMLSNVSGKRLQETESNEAALGTVHADLMKFFLESITEEARKEWGYDG